MLKIQENYDLKNNTTWHISTIARGYIEISSEEILEEVVKSNILKNYDKYHILGSGANTLFSDNKYEGLILKINLKSLIRTKADEKYEYWKAMAGEDWVKLVEFFAMRDLGGVENLAYIPGTAGAAPVQNIAAYGMSFEDSCESVEVFDLTSAEKKVYMKSECGFGYRDSIFKRRMLSNDKSFVITAINLRLTKAGFHRLVNDYHSISERLADKVAVEENSTDLERIYKAVISIRKGKLPDHNNLGTNGSLFMNPLVTGIKLKVLLEKFPKLQYYPAEKMQYVNNATSMNMIIDTNLYKIAAAHIFDTLGWKGKRVGNVGTWEKQALVLCSFGAKESKEIMTVITMMQEDFAKATGIMLEPEINIIA